jgi:hypothetical protein
MRKQASIDSNLGYYACFRCNVTPKNVKTKKIFATGKFQLADSVLPASVIKSFFYLYITCFRRNVLEIRFVYVISLVL